MIPAAGSHAGAGNTDSTSNDLKNQFHGNLNLARVGGLRTHHTKLWVPGATPGVGESYPVHHVEKLSPYLQVAGNGH